MGKDFTSAKGDDNIYTPYSFTKQLLKNEKFDYNKKFGEPACGEGAIVKVLKEKGIKDLVIGDKYFKDIYDKTDFLNSNEWDVKVDYIVTNPPYSKLNSFINRAKKIAIEKFAFLCKITHLGGVDRFNSKIFLDSDYPLTKIYMFTRQSNLRFFNKEKELENLNFELKVELSNCLVGKQNDDIIKKLNKKIENAKKQINYPCLREDGKYPAGMYYYVWLVFENYKKYNYMTKEIMNNVIPQFKWINNQDYILNKEDIK